MTLQMLQYFIAVAKYQNFTKAAQSCYVTQPALSRAIQDLEEELKCRLLIRTSRSVMLTPEGEVCLEEAKRILKQCDQLAERVRKAGLENRRPLRMAYLIYGHLNMFIKFLTDQVPDGMPFALETEYCSPSMGKKRFLAGEMDALLLPEPGIEDMNGIEYTYIVKGRAYAIVHKTNALFDRETLMMSDLKDKPFIMWNEQEQPLLCASYIRMCREAGFMPRIVGRGEKIGDITALVALYNAVGLAAKASSFIDGEDFRCMPIEDSPERFGLVCVWKKGKQSSPLMALKQILTEANGGEIIER